MTYTLRSFKVTGTAPKQIIESEVETVTISKLRQSKEALLADKEDLEQRLAVVNKLLAEAEK